MSREHVYDVTKLDWVKMAIPVLNQARAGRTPWFLEIDRVCEVCVSTPEASINQWRHMDTI